MLKLSSKKCCTSMSEKYLGTILDERLQWNVNISQLCLNLFKAKAMPIRYYETTLGPIYYAIVFQTFTMPGIKMSNIIIELASSRGKLRE